MKNLKTVRARFARNAGLPFAQVLTEAKILDYYKNLKTGPDEALLFFYAGHGAYDNAKKEPVFELKRGDKVIGILRRTVVQAMEAKGAGLTVILSDCCSSPVKLAQLQFVSRAPARTPYVALNPNVRALFFQHRGTVDVTVACHARETRHPRNHGQRGRIADRHVIGVVRLLAEAPHGKAGEACAVG